MAWKFRDLAPDVEINIKKSYNARRVGPVAITAIVQKLCPPNEMGNDGVSSTVEMQCHVHQELFAGKM